MKGQIITETVFSDAIAYNIGYTIKRIIIPEADNLAVDLDNNRLNISTGFEKEKSTDLKILKKIEVPDGFVKKSMDFLKIEKDLRREAKMLLEKKRRR